MTVSEINPHYLKTTLTDPVIKKILVIASLLTFVLLNTLLLSPNFTVHFQNQMSKFYPLQFFYNFYTANALLGIGLLIPGTLVIILVLLLYSMLIAYLGHYHIDPVKNEKTIAVLFSIWTMFLIFLNLITSISDPTGYLLALASILVVLIFAIRRPVIQRTKIFLENDENKFLFLILIVIYCVTVLVRLVTVGVAYDIHADEALYMTEGRSLSQGFFTFGTDHFPFLPVILSIPFGISPTIASSSIFLILLNSFIPLAGYAFGSLIFKNKKAGIGFAIVLIFSPLLILYSNRAFMDSVGLLLFLLTGEAVLRRRNPIYTGVLGMFLTMDKPQYFFQAFFFLSLLLWSNKSQNLKEDVKHALSWLVYTLLAFLATYIPVFVVVRSGMLFGHETDPELNFLQLLPLDQVSTNLTQYINWASLRTDYLHSGLVGTDTPIFYISIMSLFIVSLVAIVRTLRTKKLDPYILPLLSFFTLLIPQVFILSICYQRYALLLNAFTFMLPIGLLAELILGLSVFIIRSFQHFGTVKPLPTIVISDLKYIVVALICFLLILPMISTYFAGLPGQSTNFVEVGYRNGADYIYTNYNTSSTVLAIDDGWRADWYFPTYTAINLVYGNGTQQFYAIIHNTTFNMNAIVFVPTPDFTSIFGTNTSQFTLIQTFGIMDLYQYNSTL